MTQMLCSGLKILGDNGDSFVSYYKVFLHLEFTKVVWLLFLLEFWLIIFPEVLSSFVLLSLCFSRWILIWLSTADIICRQKLELVLQHYQWFSCFLPFLNSCFIYIYHFHIISMPLMVVLTLNITKCYK